MLTDSGSWQGMITSGIAEDKALQCKSLAWIREQSMNERCVESLANHDAEVMPHAITLYYNYYRGWKDSWLYHLRPSSR